MIKGLKFGIITSVVIIGTASIPIFVTVKHTIDTKYTFNLNDIITYCDGKENTMDYFKDNYSNEMFKPSKSEMEKWNLADNDGQAMLSLGLVKRMSTEQLSYDIAYWVSNWWQKVYNWNNEMPNQPAAIPFLPGYSDWNTANKDWKKQWSFTVNVDNIGYAHSDVDCSFTINFHCDSWKEQMYWASHNNVINSVTSDGVVTVSDALILTSKALIDDWYFYHINTEDLPLQSKDNKGPEFIKVKRYQCYGNTWVDQSYGNFGGPDNNGPNAFKMDSFILNNYHVLLLERTNL